MSAPLQAPIAISLAVLGGAALGGAACSVPGTLPAPAEASSASEAPSSASEAPSSAASPPAQPAPAAQPTPAHGPAADVAPATAPDSGSPAPSPAEATGECTGRSTLRTATGEVRCYPYRCRGGRCLTSCQKDEDCAGSRGPAEMAEHGWPLACAAAAATCFPLAPHHVHPH